MESTNFSRRMEIHLWSVIIQTIGVSRWIGKYIDRNPVNLFKLNQSQSVLECLGFAFLGLVLGFSAGYILIFTLFR